MFSTTPTFGEDGAAAVFHVSGSSGFALGHYPGDPIFPGVQSLHLMQSLAEAFVGNLRGAPCRAAGLKRVSYLDLVRPGDVALLECDPPQPDRSGAMTVARVRLWVGNRLCAKSEFLFDPS